MPISNSKSLHMKGSLHLGHIVQKKCTIRLDKIITDRVCTVCPRSSYPFQIVTTSWTYSNGQQFPLVKGGTICNL